MFADFFQLRFAKDDPLRNRGIVRLGSERIQFAKNFLSDEFQRATDRFVPAKMMSKLGEMAFDAREFFRNVRAVGEERDLFYQTLVVDRNRQAGLLDSLEQRGAIFLYDLRMQTTNLFDLFAHRLQATD